MLLDGWVMRVYTVPVRLRNEQEVMRMMDFLMRIGICDDDPNDLQRIVDMNRKIAESEDIECSIFCYEKGTDLLDALERGAKFHILFLDVMMPELNGIQLATAIRAKQSDVQIVFASSNREMALYGYEVAALRYLAKPLEEEKLREALLFCYRAERSKQGLLLPTARGSRKFAIDEIVYVETWGRGVRLILEDGQEEVGMKISDLEALLPSHQFVQCHRTLLVNLAFVRYLRYCELELKTGSILPISKYRQNATREKLLNYLEN